MKIATNAAMLSLLLATPSSAFTPASAGRRSGALSSAVATAETTGTIGLAPEVPVAAPAVEPITQGMDVDMPMMEEETTSGDRIEPGRYSNKDNSIAIPFLMRPPALDGSHAGDYGFDPLGFTETYDLYTMQESEIRHGRLAMLAVIGWPMSELVAPDWMLQENGCAPSVLNGFNPLTAFTTLVIFGGLGLFEYKTAFRRSASTPMGELHHSDMADVWNFGVAGDYNFDPLNFYSSIGGDAYSRKGLRDVEISHGRSAMLGITAFAAWEKLTGHPIVENSMFFHPNLLLPALVAGYFAFNSVYELEESDTFIQFKMTSEGEARVENLKMALPQGSSGDTEETMEKLMDTVEAAKEFAAKLNLPEKYEQVQEAYYKNVVQKN